MGKRYLEVCVWESIVLKYQWNWPKHFVPNKETPSCHLTPRDIVGNMQTVRFREVHSKFSIIHSLLLPLTCQSPLIVFCLYIVINDGDVSNIYVYVYPLSFHLFITPFVNIHQKIIKKNPFCSVFCHRSFFLIKCQIDILQSSCANLLYIWYFNIGIPLVQGIIAAFLSSQYEMRTLSIFLCLFWTYGEGRWMSLII